MTLEELLRNDHTLVDKTLIIETSPLKDYEHEIDSLHSFKYFGIPSDLLELEIQSYYYRIEGNNLIFVANVFRKRETK